MMWVAAAKSPSAAGEGDEKVSRRVGWEGGCEYVPGVYLCERGREAEKKGWIETLSRRDLEIAVTRV